MKGLVVACLIVVGVLAGPGRVSVASIYIYRSDRLSFLFFCLYIKLDDLLHDGIVCRLFSDAPAGSIFRRPGTPGRPLRPRARRPQARPTSQAMISYTKSDELWDQVSA